MQGAWLQERQEGMLRATSGLKGPNALHIVVDGNEGAQQLKVFGRDGHLVFRCAAHTWGQHENWRLPNGDTPPGKYEVGTIYDTTGEAPYGHYCIDLVDLEGQETLNGRAGISLHGGGSGLSDPFAPRQGWVATHGCIRVQNEDLEHIVALIRDTVKHGSNVLLTVVPYR